jgi:hypothetical protein
MVSVPKLAAEQRPSFGRKSSEKVFKKPLRKI